MHYTIQSGQRLLRAGIAAALLGLAGQSAIAQEIPVHEAHAQAKESLTVVRDRETGELRNATAAEQAALKAQAASRSRSARVAPQQVLPKTHASGARGVRLTDDFISSSVAVRKADGSIEKQCFESHGGASGAIATGHVHATQAVTE
ncbi:post-PEP-CTERM-1 domain-containing protein [Massilia sp. HP4]|uniref:post-PEP-CTERM-1 domain-containing protein n=1 Tax=Massilia sp. HP4 TaxID=2562316 RepID=UPI0010BFD7BD|nr:hypothetical protein [Massilia sp. HP4]